MQTVKFKFMLGQKIKIIDIGLFGNVISLSKDAECFQYRIVYWSNGNRNTGWVYEWEIEAAP